MDIRRPVFLKRWPQNVAIISNKYVAVISDKYVAVISDKYVTVISDKYVAVISDKYEAIISDERRHKNPFFLCHNYWPFLSKNCQFWDKYLYITVP